MSSKNIFGVTDAKKTEISALESRVLIAQNTVEKSQAIVVSLTEKSEKIMAELATRDTNKANALHTKDLVDTVIDQVKALCSNSKIVTSQIKDSSAKIKSVASDIKMLIDKLIYSVEVINKLSNLIIRKKAMNPLISDELISLITRTGTDANNAVALTLNALTTVFNSQTTTMESEAVIDLENVQVEKLYAFMTKEDTFQEGELSEMNIKTLIDQMYKDSQTLYTSALDASNDIAKQLRSATADLDRAKINLSSLETGLAAANAAALSS